MKVSDARLMATWWPAMASVPIHPIISATKAKAPNSSVYWQPIGKAEPEHSRERLPAPHLRPNRTQVRAQRAAR